MGTFEEIVKAIEHLPPEEQAKFRAWYEEFDAAVFDAKIARDSASGKLDSLAAQALADFRSGCAREL